MGKFLHWYYPFGAIQICDQICDKKLVVVTAAWTLRLRENLLFIDGCVVLALQEFCKNKKVHCHQATCISSFNLQLLKVTDQNSGPLLPFTSMTWLANMYNVKVSFACSQSSVQFNDLIFVFAPIPRHLWNTCSLDIRSMSPTFWDLNLDTL